MDCDLSENSLDLTSDASTLSEFKIDFDENLNSICDKTNFDKQ